MLGFNGIEEFSYEEREAWGIGEFENKNLILGKDIKNKKLSKKRQKELKDRKRFLGYIALGRGYFTQEEKEEIDKIRKELGEEPVGEK